MSRSDGNQRSRLSVTSEPDVRIIIRDAVGTWLAQHDGALDVELPRGLYRVQLERGRRITSHLVDHDGATVLQRPGPDLTTPALLRGAVTSHEYYTNAAELLSTSDTCAPLGGGPHNSRLFIFLRRESIKRGPPQLPSEPVTIHDVTGRRLATFCWQTTRVDPQLGYVAFSGKVTSGTYRLRASRARRDVAITIPERRAAHVFVADDGRVRLEDLRISLRPVGVRFDPSSPIDRAMEAVLAALAEPGRELPAVARTLLPAALDSDLCFGIAVAHVLRRSADLRTLHEVMPHLIHSAGDLPDVAILSHVARADFGPEAFPPYGASKRTLSAPPLFRASMVMAMTRAQADELDVDPYGAIAQAARSGYQDSIWCSWSDRKWDERWIAPTIESLRTLHGNSDVTTIARALAVPVRTVTDTIRELDANSLSAGAIAGRAEEVRVPGYTIEDVLGRGSSGTVFRATRTKDLKVIALKVVPLRGDSDQRRRTAREFEFEHVRVSHELVPHIEHPRLLTPSDHGLLPDDTGYWFALELCRGSALDLLCDADAPLAPERASELVLQALDGLADLHARGIVHRDIKPSSLLVRDDGSAVLSDLGSERHLDALLRSGPSATGGAGGFAPREQVLGFWSVTKAADVWSMAATLYFMLTLDLPRDTYTDQSEGEATLANPIVPISERWPEVPPLLARCLERALSDDPAVRPADAAEFRMELIQALSPGSVTHHSTAKRVQPKTDGRGRRDAREIRRGPLDYPPAGSRGDRSDPTFDRPQYDDYAPVDAPPGDDGLSYHASVDEDFNRPPNAKPDDRDPDQ